jgi:hypothetical protein
MKQPKEPRYMTLKEKQEQMFESLKESLLNGDFEDALTILSMIKNAEQLRDWVSE